MCHKYNRSPRDAGGNLEGNPGAPSAMSEPDLPLGFATPRLVARPYRLEDAGSFHEAVMETLVQLRRWPQALPWAQAEQSLAFAEQFCLDRSERRATRRELAYLIFQRESQRLIGAIGLHQIDWHLGYAVVGAWCRTSCQHRGLIAEALQELLQQAAQLQLQSIEAHTDSGNLPSRRFLERFGFTRLEKSTEDDAHQFEVYLVNLQSAAV